MTKETNKPKVLIILGPTSSGKSSLGVKLAKEVLAVSGVESEIISVDSRQVYKGLDIGSGKITEPEMEGVPHHGLDLVTPDQVYSVKDFQDYCFDKISEIISFDKLPILVGGTGFFIQGIVDNIKLPEVGVDEDLRKELSLKTNEELYEIIKEKNPQKAEEAKRNTHRLIRYAEILKTLGKIPEIKKQESEYDFIQIGLDLPIEEIREKISLRLDERMKDGMVEEIEKLRKEGLSDERIHGLGFDSRYILEFLEGKISKEEMTEKIKIKEGQYAKRQKTWFKKDERINWFSPNDFKEIKNFVLKSL